jgi:triosephosphate isomerase
MRKPIIAGNWKLNKTVKESIDLVTLLKRSITEFDQVEVVVCPVYTALASVAEVLMGSEIKLGAQDLYWEDKGAFTGQVSGPLLKEAGATFVIIGHSERRQFFHETDETVNKKIKAALKNSLIPIFCVGESLKEREANETFRVIDTQLKGGLANFTAIDLSTAVIAYEPVWAIGTGKVATPQQAQEVHAHIRREIAKLFNEELAKNIRILYGGSVKADNISSLMTQADIDGALVGGASLEADSFADIVKNSAVVGVK